MHSVLFVATITSQGSEWEGFIRKVEPKLAKCEGVERLAENIWLLDLQKSVASLAWLVTGAEDRGTVAYRILPFEHAPEWLPVGSDPKTTLDRSV